MATGAKITSWGHDAKDKRLAKDAKCSRLYINEPQLHGGKVYSLFFDETRLVSKILGLMCQVKSNTKFFFFIGERKRGWQNRHTRLFLNKGGRECWS